MGGPLVNQVYIGDWRLEYPISHGPFHTLHEMLRSSISCYRAEAEDPRQHRRSQYDAPIGHIELIDDYRAEKRSAAYTIDKSLSDVAMPDIEARLDEIRSQLEAELD